MSTVKHLILKAIAHLSVGQKRNLHIISIFCPTTVGQNMKIIWIHGRIDQYIWNLTGSNANIRIPVQFSHRCQLGWLLTRNSFVYLFVCLKHSSVFGLICLPIYSFICSFVHLFVRSFAHSSNGTFYCFILLSFFLSFLFLSSFLSFLET